MRYVGLHAFLLNQDQLLINNELCKNAVHKLMNEFIG